MKPYRSKIRIIADILRAVGEEGEARVTKILLHANLSHGRLMKYLEELLGKGLVEEVEESGGKAFRLTEKGFRFLEEFERAERLAEAFGFRL